MYRPRTWFLLVFVLYAVVIRLLPYLLRAVGVEIPLDRPYFPWNFMPLTALCLFSGAHLASRRWAYILPLAVILVTCAGMALLPGDIRSGFYEGTPVLLAAFALNIALGTCLRERRRPWMIGGTALLAETLFFLITNLGVWWISGMYPHTATGLLASYVAGLWFFRNALLGTALFTAIAFSPIGVVSFTKPAPVLVEQDSSQN